MAITKERKHELVTQYTDSIGKSSAVFLTRYQGIPVNDMTGLRHKLREANGSYAIVKNTLVRRVLEEAGLLSDPVAAMLEGPIGVGFCYGDPPPVAKVLVDFADDHDRFEVTAVLLGEQLLDEKAVQDLADLPPLEVLHAQILGLISTPASQLAGVVASGVRQIVNVLNAYATSGDNGGESGEAEAESGSGDE